MAEKDAYMKGICFDFRHALWKIPSGMTILTFNSFEVLIKYLRRSNFGNYWNLAPFDSYDDDDDDDEYLLRLAVSSPAPFLASTPLFFLLWITFLVWCTNPNPQTPTSFASPTPTPSFSKKIKIKIIIIRLWYKCWKRMRLRRDCLRPSICPDSVCARSWRSC